MRFLFSCHFFYSLSKAPHPRGFAIGMDETYRIYSFGGLPEKSEITARASAR